MFHDYVSFQIIIVVAVRMMMMMMMWHLLVLPELNSGGSGAVIDDVTIFDSSDVDGTGG